MNPCCTTVDDHKMAALCRQISTYRFRRGLEERGCSRSSIQAPPPTHQYGGVELVEALHRAITEAVAQVLLHKVRVVQDVVRHQRLLSAQSRRDGKRNMNTVEKSSCMKAIEEDRKDI